MLRRYEFEAMQYMLVFNYIEIPETLYIVRIIENVSSEKINTFQGNTIDFIAQNVSKLALECKETQIPKRKMLLLLALLKINIVVFNVVCRMRISSISDFDISGFDVTKHIELYISKHPFNSEADTICELYRDVSLKKSYRAMFDKYRADVDSEARETSLIRHISNPHEKYKIEEQIMKRNREAIYRKWGIIKEGEELLEKHAIDSRGSGNQHGYYYILNQLFHIKYEW